MSNPRLRLRAIGSKFDKTVWETTHSVRIGRIDDVEIVLNDTSISRYHAEITFADKSWSVRDLGSTNGTLVNGVRLGRNNCALKPGDLLQCGNAVLCIEAATDGDLDTSENSISKSLLVAEVAQQSLEEAAQVLVSDIARSQRPGDQLLHLLQAGQFLNWTDSVDELLAHNLQDTAMTMGARRGALVLIDAETQTMSLRAVYPAVNRETAEGRFFSQTLARRSFLSGESLLCADIGADPELMNAASVRGGSMSSVICALLRSPKRYLGVLHLDRGLTDDPFTRDDLHRADALALNMAFAFENAHRMHERHQELFIQTVTAFSEIVELRDPYTGGHSQRVTDYALLLANQMKLSDTQRHQLRLGAPLHDIGKIGIDDAILRKPGRLSDEENELMKQHTVMGASLVKTLHGLDIVLPIVRNHHERWDGKGYPDQLAGTAIPLLARVVAVADTFDAMTTDRPYRLGMPLDQALALIQEGAGTQFDSDCVHAFLSLRSVLDVRLKNKDTPPSISWAAVASFARQASSTSCARPQPRPAARKAVPSRAGVLASTH